MSNVIPGPGYGPLEGAVETHGTQVTGLAGRPANTEPLHIVCQDGQPYGSSRRCCSYCGIMCWPGMKGSAARWVTSWEQFDVAPDRCSLASTDSGAK